LELPLQREWQGGRLLLLYSNEIAKQRLDAMWTAAVAWGFRLTEAKNSVVLHWTAPTSNATRSRSAGALHLYWQF